MHAFMLILAFFGQPEKMVAICDTYVKCDDMGREQSTLYMQQFHKPLAWRVVPVIILEAPEVPTT